METLYTVFLVSQFVSAGVAFLLLYFVSAPYGRHARSGWGPTVGARTAWVLMEFPAPFSLFVLFFTGSVTCAGAVFLLIWQTHYLYRTFIYPFLLTDSKRVPLLIVLFSLMFNGMNGFINGYYLFHLSAEYNASWFATPHFVIGTALFLMGFGINVHSDRVIRKLRAEHSGEYRIPCGGLHRFVASPNYFGEIVEWAGWAVLTWSLPGLAFFVFTAANLVPRAHEHRKWYRRTFSDYPQRRKRVIPFLY